MKFAAAVLSALLLFGAAAATAQDPTGAQGKVQHVIVVIQENRTPDNLFGGDAMLPTGANIATQGLKYNSNPIKLTALPLYTCFDLGHTNKDFQDMCHLNTAGVCAMDGAYDEQILPSNGCTTGITNAQYHFADNSGSNTNTPTNPPAEMQPYFDIAYNYGFANYMFQTNQGPSFPAHQFLFSGTSAPVLDDASTGLDPGLYWQWFASENPGNGNQTGCFGLDTNTVLQLPPSGGQELLGWLAKQLLRNARPGGVHLL
jgi:hypothetical protein